MPTSRRRPLPPAAGSGWLYLALLVLGATLFLPWLGHNDLMNEETRRALIARNMMESGNYLIPQYAERIYLNKPPLYNWLVAAFSLPAGTVTELTARLPSVAAVIALACFMAYTGRHLLGGAGRWFLGLSVLTTGLLAQKAVIGTMDLTFTLLVTVSLWLWFDLDQRGRRGIALWLPPALAVAAAFLAKREPALVFYYLGIGAYLLTQRRLGELFTPGHLLAALVTLVLAGAWYALLAVRVGGEAVWRNFVGEVLSRGINSEPGDYLVHIATYPLELLVGLLPFSPLLALLLWPSLRRGLVRHYRPALGFAAVVALVNLPVYWLRADAAVRYYMPMLPTLLAIAAMAVDHAVRRPGEWSPAAWRWLRGTGWVMLGLAALFAGAALVALAPGWEYPVVAPFLPAWLVALMALAVLAGVAWAARRFRRRAVVLATVGMVGAGIVFRGVLVVYGIPAEARRIEIKHDDVPAILDRIRDQLPPGVDHVQAFGSLHRAFWFYDRRGLIVPMARYERRGCLASPYLLFWTQHAPERFHRRFPDARAVTRLPYFDHDLLLARAADAGAVCPEARDGLDTAPGQN